MNWIPIALLGGVVGLDATSFPQVMISRPLVAGALAGLVFGVPVEGALVGAFLEIFHLAILPIGAAKYPEAGTAAVAAIAAYAGVPLDAGDGGALILVLAFALGWERVGGASVTAFRRSTERLVFAGSPQLHSARQLEWRHVAAMILDGTRGALVCLAGAALGTVLLRASAPLWEVPVVATRGVLAIAGAAVLAGTLTVFGGWTLQRRLFLLGALCGSILLALR
jgi:mannose/fructose/N-acetylgalactosamine-specific phosphotransferase system component IIC